ncbi:PREDICTED: conserved oligomeric Golgi complex subunit 3 [Eufriesea mexicana]|uniref:conserved oligomeric Golgi complex subunit 3 n=1 Tax=Eufriesea mexicana TaxID=516756 RepID=UPI00083BA84E|nr:PREDICTED: conserved oligomeric Golgi complex subunit 3 [Eufriesea mexicana]
MSKTKNIPNNLTKWDLSEDSLAPLTDYQKECLLSLEEELFPDSKVKTEEISDTVCTNGETMKSVQIERCQDLLEHYDALEQKCMDRKDMKYKLYLNELQARRQECNELCLQIEDALENFTMLSKQYSEVSDKTVSLYDASEQLDSDQRKLNSTIESITEYVKYFKDIDMMMEKLEAPTLSVNSEMFFNILDKIDSNIDFVQNNPSFKESNTYLIKYKHCQSKAISMIQNYIFNLFSKTTESILNLKDNDDSQDNTDAALALFYGRFQTILSKARPVIEQIEAKSYKRQEYDSLLSECHQCYWSQRGLVLGDLAYPEKLKMMEDIAESIREESRQTKIKRISVSSNDENVLEPISRNHIEIDTIYQKTHMGNSPADLHGMWYPTVRRTLVCLSRLYRCVDRSVFQSLSQEAISLCVQSIENARQEIEKRASSLDAELFQIKHLLILREQIAPFQVDFTIKEYSLDFSKVKTAAFGLLEKSSRLFTLSNNALLEFLLEGAPQMKEQLIDSRKHVDNKLKYACQRLIQYATFLLIHPILKLLEKEKLHVNNPDASQEHMLGSPQDVAAAISEVLRIIKFKCPEIQHLMQLYLSNKETEFILFRPVKNNVCAAFTQLYQILSKYYNSEELLLIACPLPEQISVILSSTSLVHGKKNEKPQRKDSKKT